MSIDQANPANCYYNDPQKLDTLEAECLVERYFRDDVNRSVTRAQHVLESEEWPCSDHNNLKVVEVLRRRCEPHLPERSGPMRFKIPERYRG